MHLRQALNAAAERLTAERVPSPRMNAELLIMFTLDCERAYLYAHPERELTAHEMQRYDEALARRATGVPAQYITGHQEFWGLDLIVSPAVLIPRPETEHVVETVLGLARDGAGDKQRRRTGVSAPHAEIRRQEAADGNVRPTQRVSAPHRIVDVGTGSGAIAIALAKELPGAEIDATDISAEALEVARANAARHELTARIRFHQTDLLRGLPPAAFDIVVSNPPYVGESEEDQVQLEVRKFEPRTAVFAGPTGLEVIERLIAQAHAALGPGGWVVFEISGTIADGVRRLLSGWSEVATMNGGKSGGQECPPHILSGWGDVAITNDLAGIARVARARKIA